MINDSFEQSSLFEDSNASFMASTISTSPLEDGKVEEKVQVDRKRLENMMRTVKKSTTLGSATSSPEEGKNEAEIYFENVERVSRAKISWPTRLKIGARTKKDPFVKIYGFADDVKLAQRMIARDLKIKKDRIILKMEISHIDHSHIIGRGGKNTQQIMQETQCHIHFPDSNKHNDIEKNDQVSIAGCQEQVDQARERLREITPVTICIEFAPHIPVHALTDIVKILNSNEVIIQFRNSFNNFVSNCFVKGTYQHEQRILHVIACMNQMLAEFETSYFMTCDSKFDVRPNLIIDPNFSSELGMISSACNVKIKRFKHPNTGLKIEGEPRSIFIARKMLTGLYPFVISFDKGAEYNNELNLAALEKKYKIEIIEKKRTIGEVTTTTIIIKGMEFKMPQIYQVRNMILLNTEDENPEIPKIIHNIPNIPANTWSSHEYAHQQMNLVSNSMTGMGINDTSCDSSLGLSLLSSGVNNFDRSSDNTIAKSSQQLLVNRDMMKYKASKALHTGLDNTSTSSQPTDYWHGYGFSSSMPADVLKHNLDDIWDNNNAHKHHLPHNNQNDSLLSIFSPTKQNPIGEEVKNNKDFYSSSNKSKFNNMKTWNDELESIWEISKSSHNSFYPDQDPQQPNQLEGGAPPNSLNDDHILSSLNLFHHIPPPQNLFAATTNVFETFSYHQDTTDWNIRKVTTPEMVLALLDCQEYLPIFREQEIDMGAFLLMDESSLKQLGINTIGSRKKIFNAILKLRESAISQENDSHLKSMLILSGVNRKPGIFGNSLECKDF
uniref:SAM domain-containing protein n=1 Tax=Rhabditophanes sp. KR3021 TaxID=114890 RepID=A0AC35U7M9_9BILA